MRNEFFGKYRGEVANNRDPINLGRIQVRVPAVLGTGRSSWAMPRTPYAGPQVGFYAMPPIGANVWVEFEGGDPDYPIWSGCFWETGQLPVLPAMPEVKVFQTEGVGLTMSNLGTNAGLTLEVTPPVAPQPLSLSMGPQGIRIDHGGMASVGLSPDNIQLTHSNRTMVTMTPTAVTLSNRPLEVTLSASSGAIELSNGTTTATLAADRVEVKQGTASVTLSPSGIQLTCNPGSLTVSTMGVEVSGGPASLNVTPATIELSNSAGNVMVSPAGVNLNNGALEVI